MRQLTKTRGVSERTEEPVAVGPQLAPLATLLGGGLQPGGTVELVGPATGLALVCASSVLAEARATSQVVLVEPKQDQERFFPAGLCGYGIEPTRLLIVRPSSQKDLLWSLEQALRCRAVGTVLARLGRTSDTAMQRLKRAAQVGGGCGFFLRPDSTRRDVCWSDMRLEVRTMAGQNINEETLRPHWRVRSLYPLRDTAAGREGEQGIEVMLNDETHLVRVAAQLARPAISPMRAFRTAANERRA
ncbi:hypothetical protein [Stratiformator vulcanicus]|nr:hypothetical protein [Stratiformator vulcanicus]